MTKVSETETTDLRPRDVESTYGQFHAQPFERGYAQPSVMRCAGFCSHPSRGGHYRGQDRGRAARVYPDPECDGRRHQHHHESETDPDPFGRAARKDDLPGSGSGGRGQVGQHRHRPGHRNPRPERPHCDRRRGRVPEDRNARQKRPRLCPRRRKLRGRPAHRLHPAGQRSFPIKRVNYSVEAARLGQTTDYDKLVLDVWTNGCIGRRTPSPRRRKS